jgi:hypothetical protein
MKPSLPGPIERDRLRDKNMGLLTRKKSDCENHDWVTTTNSGLRRSFCRGCGAITLEPVAIDLTVPESLIRTKD